MGSIPTLKSLFFSMQKILGLVYIIQVLLFMNRGILRTAWFRCGYLLSGKKVETPIDVLHHNTAAGEYYIIIMLLL